MHAGKQVQKENAKIIDLKGNTAVAAITARLEQAARSSAAN
jgi:hypothetical protein